MKLPLFKKSNTRTDTITNFGSENNIEINDTYYVSELKFNAGLQYTMRYHLKVDKTWYVIDGLFIYSWIDTNTGKQNRCELKNGDAVRQLPGQPHGLTCIMSGTIIEITSNRHENDVYFIDSGSFVQEYLRGHVYHTLGNKTIDLTKFDFNDKSQGQVEREYGWEAAMYWSNIHMGELESFFQIKPGDIFVDMGSNIGMSATYAELKGASKIYCIEPDPNVFKCLEKNRNSNWILDNVAISKQSGFETIKLWPGEEKISVPALNFNDYIQKRLIHKIDYLKIDIEGAELDVLYSISDENWSIIDKLFLEYHEDVYEFSPKTREDLIKYLLSKGLSNYHIKLGDYQSLFYFWR